MKSREFRTKVTLDLGLSLPEEVGGRAACPLRSFPWVRFPLWPNSGNALIPFVGAKGFNIPVLDPRLGNFINALNNLGSIIQRNWGWKKKNPKLSSQISEKEVNTDLHSMFYIKITGLG